MNKAAANFFSSGSSNLNANVESASNAAVKSGSATTTSSVALAGQADHAGKYSSSFINLFVNVI